MALTLKQKNQLEKTHESGAVGVFLRKSKKITGLAALNQANSIKNALLITQNENIPSAPHNDNKINNNTLEISLKNEEKIFSIDTSRIKNWSFNDRPEQELGDIESLANELKNIGQQHPCIVRKIQTSQFDYEIIAGERRWRAAKKAGIKLKVIIKELTDFEAAICQAAENSHRKDLSDYAKGMNYSKLISAGIISEQSLIKNLVISQSDLSRLLSFDKIPKEIWAAIGDTSLISARTAAEIRSLIKKGSTYIEAIKKLAPKLRTGKFGAHKLKNAIEKTINKNTENLEKQEVRSRDGRHLFTWRKDSNGNLSISFPKDIQIGIKKDSIENSLKHALENLIISLHSTQENK